MGSTDYSKNLKTFLKAREGLFRFFRSHSFCHSYVNLPPGAKAAAGLMKTSEYGCAPTKLYLQRQVINQPALFCGLEFAGLWPNVIFAK
jgi:hypothetical protein